MGNRGGGQPRQRDLEGPQFQGQQEPTIIHNVNDRPIFDKKTQMRSRSRIKSLPPSTMCPTHQ